jgi:hypothetical protein
MSHVLCTRICNINKAPVGAVSVQVRVKVTLRLTVSQSVCLGVEPNLGQLTRVYFLLEI